VASKNKGVENSSRQSIKPKLPKPGTMQNDKTSRIKSLLDKYSIGSGETETESSLTAMAVRSGSRFVFPKKNLEEAGMTPIGNVNTVPANSYSVQAFRAKLDLKGYRNDEISLDMEGRRLVVGDKKFHEKIALLKNCILFEVTKVIDMSCMISGKK